MARKAQENPQLDMTPMIDVVFELIIFFVVTLTQCQAKDETIKLRTDVTALNLLLRRCLRPR
jgi:biopolymer transport protein ExbD